MEFILDTLGKVGFEWQMGLFNLINFILVFWILKRFFFASVMKTITDRKELINTGVENAQKAKTELHMAERKAQELVDEAKAEANKILVTAHDEAAGMGDVMKAKAKEEIETLIAQAKKQIDGERDTMRAELKKEMVDLIALSVEKIIGEKLDGEKERVYVMEMLEKVEKHDV